ncbi:unnamed protein product [Meloidogyne enterolobii]|uniref:Uncharacterized protein n=1 Tax=Meloidogyne enterolobii TaxID=390850 RepID=A0ACB0XSG5_MELEN
MLAMSDSLIGKRRYCSTDSEILMVVYGFFCKNFLVRKENVRTCVLLEEEMKFCGQNFFAKKVKLLESR